MESSEQEAALIPSVVGLCGFGENVTAKNLADFLLKIDAGILRCKVKRSWTPLDSFPIFDASVATYGLWTKDDKSMLRHAFVHFATCDGAEKVIAASGKRELQLDSYHMKAHMSTENSYLANRRTIQPFKFTNVSVEIGNQVSIDEFLVSWKESSSATDFVIDSFDGSCKILFTKDTYFSFIDKPDIILIKCDFKVEFLAGDISEIRVFNDDASLVVQFQLVLGSGPYVYYRTANDDIYEPIPLNLLDDEDPWIRTTDFSPSAAIGRCNTYRILLSPDFKATLERALSYLKGVSKIQLEHQVVVRDEPNFGVYTSDPFFSFQNIEGINFSTIFLVNLLVHRGIISQHQLSEEFFSVLRCQSDDIVNEASLMHILSYTHSIFDAPRRLKLIQGQLNPKLLRCSNNSDDTIAVRRLVITPTRAYCLPSEVELSNRVLRKYKEYSDRFLRVTFMDEGMQRLNDNVLKYYVAHIVKITIPSFPHNTTVFKRINNILTNGFHLCGRKYTFLAFSANQLRDQSAWFVAELPKILTVSSIRSWMGKFSNKSVAKCTARMGQCFSSTYATVNVPQQEVNPDFEDIERNDYIFSDGIGKITPDLAREVADKLQLTENPPSAYQIRYAGCKGVIAVWPGHGDGIRLFLRPSMTKFESDHTTLEVVSWSRFQPVFLNRQIVILLSSLMVPDYVFERMQDSMIRKLNQMLEDTDVAFEVLTTSCAEQGNTAAMMLSAGFKPQTEPHLKAMLSCIRSAQLDDLLEKARIFVSKGRSLMGCLDEIGILKQGQCFIQASTPSLENCFIKHVSSFSATKKNREVVVGTVAIAKNPCLHPGDIRILEAIDVPELHHLVDCLVFPQNGDRPHANEASGSDLDGDLYFVTWDENLLPPDKKSCKPMEYNKPTEDDPNTADISPQDIIDFFLKNMVDSSLGIICNAHVAHADRSENGAMDDKCLTLAKMAADAVDFPKTGKIVTMPPDLKPDTYPDFMGKYDRISYKSEKILGRLYRIIKDAIDNDPQSKLTCTAEGLSYDVELEVTGSSDYYEDAWEHKVEYDRQLNALLAQYSVKSEGEVVAGHVWTIPKYMNNKHRGDLKERLKIAYHVLNKKFRKTFETISPDSDYAQLSKKEKCLLYQKKASAWYQVTYHPRWVTKSSKLEELNGNKVASRLSFAWIPVEYLVMIKLRCQQREFDRTKPIDALAAYLFERILC